MTLKESSEISLSWRINPVALDAYIFDNELNGKEVISKDNI